MEIQKAEDVVLAEAAAWIARLQGTGRSAAAEAAFREWLAADSAHARAFARATDVWDVIPGAARINNEGADERVQSNPASARIGAAARTDTGNRATRHWRSAHVLGGLIACSIAAVVLGILLLRPPAFATEVGQQRSQTLTDGTRVSLNTNSRIVLVYSDRERRVRIERGEALFEVARDIVRPFVVEAGEEQVRALGTTFLVRRDPAGLAVTLIEGRVEVTRRKGGQDDVPRVMKLEPGQRITVHAHTPPTLDRPKVEALTAWRHGEVIFDDVSLLEAVSEINRYGSTHVMVTQPELMALRISGIFETRDPAEFANAIARLHRLAVHRSNDEIVLSR
jgi:transmembrane sensor